MTEPIVASPPVKFSQAEFDALITKAGEAGARQYASLAQAKTKEDEDEDEAEDTKTVTLEQAGALGGLVETLDTIGGINIPFGSVLVGAIPAVVVGELVDGLVPPKTATGAVNWMNVAVKSVAAVGGVQFGRQFIGTRGTMFFTGVLALQVASNILPIDEWIANLVGMFRRGTPTAEAANAWLGQSFKPNTGQGGYWS